MSGRNCVTFVLGAVFATSIVIAASSAAHAADCPRDGTLGTSRVRTVDPKATPRVGLQSFPQTLPLEDHEVVLTFDDGPHGPTTSKILEALAKECVHATFFMIGQSAAANPALVKRIAAEGHTVAHHTWAHADLKKIDNAAAIATTGSYSIGIELHVFGDGNAAITSHADIQRLRDRAGEDVAQAAEIEFSEARMTEHRHQHRRHGEGKRAALLLEQFEMFKRIERN